VSEHENPKERSLVPSGPDCLIPIREVNPLVHRGLAELSDGTRSTDLDSQSTHPFDLALNRYYNTSLRRLRLLTRLRELHAGRPARAPNSQHEVPKERSPEDLPPPSGNAAGS
jgi:hypothetical protein